MPATADELIAKLSAEHLTRALSAFEAYAADPTNSETHPGLRARLLATLECLRHESAARSAAA